MTVRSDANNNEISENTGNNRHNHIIGIIILNPRQYSLRRIPHRTVDRCRLALERHRGLISLGKMLLIDRQVLSIVLKRMPS